MKNNRRCIDQTRFPHRVFLTLCLILEFARTQNQLLLNFLDDELFVRKLGKVTRHYQSLSGVENQRIATIAATIIQYLAVDVVSMPQSQSRPNILHLYQTLNNERTSGLPSYTQTNPASPATLMSVSLARSAPNGRLPVRQSTYIDPAYIQPAYAGFNQGYPYTGHNQNYPPGYPRPLLYDQSQGLSQQRYPSGYSHRAPHPATSTAVGRLGYAPNSGLGVDPALQGNAYPMQIPRPGRAVEESVLNVSGVDIVEAMLSAVTMLHDILKVLILTLTLTLIIITQHPKFQQA